MYEKIKVGCPYCGSVVVATNLPDIQSKAFRCKVCGNVARFSACQSLGYVDPAKNFRENPSTFGRYPKFKVSCPRCGNIVRVPNNPGVGDMGFQCSNCGTRARISNCHFLGYLDHYGNSVNSQAPVQRRVSNYEDRTVYAGMDDYDPYGNKPFARPGEVVKIRCKCGQMFTFKYREGAENAIMKCPKCSNQARVSEYERVREGQEPKPAPAKPKIGILKIKGTNKTFQLRLGENVIGKKANSSTATIQIECDTRRLSRQHIVINVKEDKKDGYIYLTRLYKSEVNDTYVGGTLLTYGDELFLKDKMEIRLPDVNVIFEIPSSK